MLMPRRIAVSCLSAAALLLTGCQGDPEPTPSSSFPSDDYATVTVRGQWVPPNGTTTRREKGKVLVNVDGETLDSIQGAMLPSSATGKWVETQYLLKRGARVELYVTLPGAVPGIQTACELEADGVTLDRSEPVAGGGNTAICTAIVPAR